MSRTKLSYAVLLAFGALAFILAACTSGGGNKGISPNLELRSDTAVAGLEAFISYDATKLEYVGVNAVEGVEVAAAVRDGGLKVALVVRDGSASGVLATVQFNAKVAGAQAKVASMTPVAAAAVALSSQAISIADIAVSADMANYQLGDATLDGSVNIFDAVAVNANANGAQATPAQKVLSDMDGNYAINNVDVSAALNKVVNAGTSALDASLVVKPQRLNLASGASGTVVVFNAGTAALNVSGASFSGASASARAEGVAGQSYAFNVSATTSGPVVVDAGAAGQQTFFVTVGSGGNGGQGANVPLYYIKDGQSVDIDPSDIGPGKTYELSDFIFKTWLENEANICNPVVSAGCVDENTAGYVTGINPQLPNGTGLNRTRPSADEKEESAPNYTQNVTAAFVFLKMGGNLYPVVGAEVRWFVDDAACWQVRDYSDGAVNQQYGKSGPEVSWVYECGTADAGAATYVRTGSIFIGAADDEEVNGAGVNSPIYAETYTNQAAGPNTLYPSEQLFDDNGDPIGFPRFPRHNRTGVDSPDRNGYTWITLYSPDHVARARVNVVAYVGGHEIDKDWLTKEFAPTPPSFTVSKIVEDPTDRIVAPGEPVTYRIEITNTGETAGTINLVDRMRVDEVIADPQWPGVDYNVDTYRLVDITTDDRLLSATDVALSNIGFTSTSGSGVYGASPVIVQQFYLDEDDRLVGTVSNTSIARNPSLVDNPANTTLLGLVSQNVEQEVLGEVDQCTYLNYAASGFTADMHTNDFRACSAVEDAILQQLPSTLVNVIGSEVRDGIHYDDYEGFNSQFTIPAKQTLVLRLTAVGDRVDEYCNISSIRGLSYSTDAGQIINVRFSEADAISDEACFEVREPVVTIDKVFLDSTGNPVCDSQDNINGVSEDATCAQAINRGDTVPVRIIIRNTGLVTAFNVKMQEILYRLNAKVDTDGDGDIDADDNQVYDGTLTGDSHPYFLYDDGGDYEDYYIARRVGSTLVPAYPNDIDDPEAGVSDENNDDVWEGYNLSEVQKVLSGQLGQATVDGFSDVAVDPYAGFNDGILPSQSDSALLGSNTTLTYDFMVTVDSVDTYNEYCDRADVFWTLLLDEYYPFDSILAAIQQDEDLVNVEIPFNPGVRSDSDLACLGVIDLDINKEHYYLADGANVDTTAPKDLLGEFVDPGEVLLPNNYYVSKIDVVNNSRATVSGVLLQDVIGQGDVSLEFVQYVASQWPTNASGSVVIHRAPNVLASALTGKDVYEEDEHLVTSPDRYSIPAGSSISFYILSYVPEDYPTDNVCNKSRYISSTGLTGTDSACIRIDRPILERTAELYEVDGTYKVGTNQQFLLVWTNEDSSTENMDNNVLTCTYDTSNNAAKAFTILGSRSIEEYEGIEVSPNGVITNRPTSFRRLLTPKSVSVSGNIVAITLPEAYELRPNYSIVVFEGVRVANYPTGGEAYSNCEISAQGVRSNRQIDETGSQATTILP